MKKIFLCLFVLFVLVGCNVIFDPYEGENLYMIKEYLAVSYPEYTFSISRSENQYLYSYSQNEILIFQARVYTKSGSVDDYYIEYIYY